MNWEFTTVRRARLRVTSASASGNEDPYHRSGPVPPAALRSRLFLSHATTRRPRYGRSNDVRAHHPIGIIKGPADGDDLRDGGRHAPTADTPGPALVGVGCAAGQPVRYWPVLEEFIAGTGMGPCEVSGAWVMGDVGVS